MRADRTEGALAAITDQGLFEELATAILREADPIYRSLTHSGVNVQGKTVRSPLDGICFVKGADPPHMIAVHHTITARDSLEKKWLHDPSNVKHREGSRFIAPAGDLIKTAELAAEERKRTPKLRVTLALTTNNEPDESLVRAVEATGRAQGMEIDLWSRSRLCHFLDNQPTGQWIRYSYLKIDQELLSPELLHHLSQKSLEINRPLDNPDAWIARSLDGILADNLRKGIIFLVAGSGLGKSVACYRKLEAHVVCGGFGITLPHEAVSSAVTLEQAIVTGLRQLHPHLVEAWASVFSFCSPERPLLLIVEDINRSGQPQRLVEKIAGWSRPPAGGDTSAPACWFLICPIWPEILASLGDQTRKHVEPLTLTASRFTESEGCDSVLARARFNGHELSSMTAAAISDALGHDPLLIALHDYGTAPNPHSVIGQFVEGSLSRAAAETKYNLAADLRDALRALARGMLANRQIDLSWREVKKWVDLQGEALRLLSLLAHQGELIQITGPTDGQKLSFRHDRVRDWVLADAAAEMDRRNLLPEDVVAEPYFAEVIGAVLVWGPPNSDLLQRVAEVNPLALFHALRLFGQATEPHHRDILQAINAWIEDPSAHNLSNLHLRWEALAMMAETDSPDVPALVCKFRDHTASGQLARLRNGDLLGGIELCIHIEPGAGAPWRDIQIEHAKFRHGPTLNRALADFLRRTDLDSSHRVGALRLAGHFAEKSLSLAIETCWATDDKRSDHLAEYLWAFAECCADDPKRFLGPVCDAWAKLSDQPQKEGWPSPRNELAANYLRWAFQKWPPIPAMDYFTERGSQADLNWPIAIMLEGVDHPKAVLFEAQALATIRRRREGTNSFSPFAWSTAREWSRAQETYGRPMSLASRDLLLRLWVDETNDIHLRTQAFALWEATLYPDDIEKLRDSKHSNELADKILWARLARGDQQAIPAMIEKLGGDNSVYWWQCGRYVWSAELTKALDELLGRRGAHAKQTWAESLGPDWITHELIMRLPEDEAERLLLKHWGHLRFAPHFVQTALYFSTPRLLEAAQAAINECPEPVKLLVHLSQHFGIHVKDRPGLIRENQILTLAPYLHLLSSLDLGALWDECNKHGWFATRRQLLDGLLQRGWDRDRTALEFDKMVTEKHQGWVDHMIDRFQNSGVSWAEIIETMIAWLDERRSIEALWVVADALKFRGTRKDLSALRIYEGMPETDAKQIILYTQFAVRRRSIS
jgi:hypothetical protein